MIKEAIKKWAWFGAAKNVVYSVIAIVGMVATALVISIRFVDSANATEVIAKTNRADIVTIKESVSGLTHKIDVSQKSINKLTTSVDKLGTDSNETTLALARLQTEVADFKTQQAELIRVLMKLNRTVENGNGH